MIFDADSGLCLSYLRTLGPKRNLDHRSFFCLDRLLMRSSKLLLFSKDVRFNSGVRLLLELYCFCHRARCLLYYLGEINSGIHMYLWTLISLLLSEVVVVSDLDKSFGGSTDLADRRIWRKKGTDRRICIRLFNPLREAIVRPIDITRGVTWFQKLIYEVFIPNFTPYQMKLDSLKGCPR